LKDAGNLEFFKIWLIFKIDPEIIEAIEKVPLPISRKDLQSFLGQTNFVHRFIPNYEEIVNPIYKLLKKDVKFEWNDQSKKSFKEIKIVIFEAPVLISTDYSKDLLAANSIFFSLPDKLPTPMSLELQIVVAFCK
jgi:hypothetical protein